MYRQQAQYHQTSCSGSSSSISNNKYTCNNNVYYHHNNTNYKSYYILLAVIALLHIPSPLSSVGVVGVSALTTCDACERSECPMLPERCPSGAGLVLDACECCALCGRTKGQACSPLQPCDRGLICDYDQICHGKSLIKSLIPAVRALCRPTLELRNVLFHFQFYW